MASELYQPWCSVAFDVDEISPAASSGARRLHDDAPVRLVAMKQSRLAGKAIFFQHSLGHFDIFFTRIEDLLAILMM